MLREQLRDSITIQEESKQTIDFCYVMTPKLCDSYRRMRRTIMSYRTKQKPRTTTDMGLRRVNLDQDIDTVLLMVDELCTSYLQRRARDLWLDLENCSSQLDRVWPPLATDPRIHFHQIVPSFVTCVAPSQTGNIKTRQITK
jgi:hypothetical protein